jgi:hypothetical protein
MEIVRKMPYPSYATELRNRSLSDRVSPEDRDIEVTGGVVRALPPRVTKHILEPGEEGDVLYNLSALGFLVPEPYFEDVRDHAAMLSMVRHLPYQEYAAYGVSRRRAPSFPKGESSSQEHAEYYIAQCHMAWLEEDGAEKVDALFDLAAELELHRNDCLGATVAYTAAYVSGLHFRLSLKSVVDRWMRSRSSTLFELSLNLAAIDATDSEERYNEYKDMAKALDREGPWYAWTAEDTLNYEFQVGPNYGQAPWTTQYTEKLDFSSLVRLREHSDGPPLRPDDGRPICR